MFILTLDKTGCGQPNTPTALTEGFHFATQIYDNIHQAVPLVPFAIPFHPERLRRPGLASLQPRRL